MQALEILQRKINSADKLLSIVKTMKALAAANMRQYEKAVESLDDYLRTVEMGFQVLFMGTHERKDISHQTSKGSVIAVVFGSDYGFTGHFNEEIVKFCLDNLNELNIKTQECTIMCVGEQTSSRLEKTGQTVETLFAVPNSLNGVNTMVHKMLLLLEEKRSSMNIDKVLLFYNRPQTGVAFEPRMVRLLPVDLQDFKTEQKKWNFRSIPTYTMDRNQLLSALIGQYIFVSLYRAFALSLASENSSRLASMQAAGKNIEELLDNIRAEYSQNRQSAITEEILDIASGFSALNPE